MELKFTFKTPPADPADPAAAVTTPAAAETLPITPQSASSTLTIRAALAGHEIVAAALGPDGSSYAQQRCNYDAADIAGGYRSAIARVTAELGDKLAAAVTGVALERAGYQALAAQQMLTDNGEVTARMQQKTGLAAGLQVTVI